MSVDGNAAWRRRLSIVASLVIAALLPAQAQAAKGLDTGFAEGLIQSGDPSTRALWLDRAQSANAGTVKLFVSWRGIVSGQPAQPRNPADPAYSFGGLDAAVSDADARGLNVLIGVNGAPNFAEGPNRAASAPAGSWKPDPGELEDFMAAISSRYSGTFSGLPRVRDFQVWNEANLSTYLTPQWNGKKSFAAPHYKKMLAAASKGVDSTNGANRVVVSGLAPYGDDPGGSRTRPLRFWREAFCLKGKKLKKVKNCAGPKAKFDVFAHHAINTSGAPRKSALHPDDASSGDLPAVAKVLRMAERRNTIKGGRHPMWITEFWWESRPPSQSGVSLSKQARYIQETLYLSWKAGFEKAIQLRLRDLPQGASTRYGDGLYFIDNSAKPSVKGFQFPFVADRKGKKKVVLWGKAPKKGKVVIQRKKGKRWKTVKKLKAGGNRIFSGKAALRGKKKLRARGGGETSLTWQLK